MRYLLLLLCFCAKADFRDSLYLYWFAGSVPGVALTSSNVVSVYHVTGAFTSVQIGDQSGVLPGLCTGFVSDGICGGSVQNCEWGHQYNNVTNDSFFFYTCRPVTLGITPIQTNVTVGSQVVWLDNADATWKSATITFAPTGTVYNFPDGETGFYQVMIFTGSTPVSGSSGSPVFTPRGEYVGAVTATSFVTNGILHALYPSGSTYLRPASPGAAGLSALFNSDPDR